MKYFKNTELAELYHVSEKSIRNWLEASQQGKVNLQLAKANNRFYVANTSANATILEQLAQKGKRFKNSRGQRTIRPAAEFYKLFGPRDIFNIISNLDVYHEIPLEYSYFDGGARIWDAYVQKLSADGNSNILSNTVQLLELNETYLDILLAGCDRINVVDIGPGNGYPVRSFLERLITKRVLNRYICLDASRDMLNIAEKNIQSWFGAKANLEAHVRDITYERFGNLLTNDSFNKDKAIRNVLLLFGSTLSNFREPQQPLTTIRESMGKDDLFIASKQLDTPHSRRHFDYYTGNETTFRLTPKSKFILELFNITEALYEAEPFFDEKTMSRRLQVRLKVDLCIEFTLEGRQKVISFNKGDTILLWRHRHQDTMMTLEQFDESGFDLLQATTSKDREYILTISKIKTTN